MKWQHPSQLARRSHRIDLFPASPSLEVAVPDDYRPQFSVNQIVEIGVDGAPVEFVLVNRNSARLKSVPAPGSMVTLYCVYPAEYSIRGVMDYLRRFETSEASHRRIMSEAASRHQDAAYPAPEPAWGLQRRQDGASRGSR